MGGSRLCAQTQFTAGNSTHRCRPDTERDIAEWKPAYKRGYAMQASLAILA